jgi:hypothetical protein
MATTVPQAFKEFAEKLKPTAAQEETIAARRASVESYLVAAYPSGSLMPLLQTRVIGSAGRKTLIRPVDDIDVFAVFDDREVWGQYESDSKQLLYRVREALDGYSVKTVGSRGEAVRLFYTDGLNVDITPAFPLYNRIFRNQEGYVIPYGNGQWIRTDPYEHHDFMAMRNKSLDNHLKPLIRILKRWNRVHSSRLKSFHLEMIAQEVFASLSGNVRLNLLMFFRDADRHLHVKDPAGYSGDLAASLTRKQQDDIKQSFAYALDHAERAQEADARSDVEESLRQWRIVLGEEFPSYGAASLGQLRLKRPA